MELMFKWMKVDNKLKKEIYNMLICLVFWRLFFLRIRGHGDGKYYFRYFGKKKKNPDKKKFE